MNIKTTILKGIQLTNKSFDLVAILILLSICSLFGLWYFSPDLLNPAPSNEPKLSTPAIVYLTASFVVTLFTLGATLNYIYHKAKFGDASVSEFTSGGQKYFWRMLKFFCISTLIIIGLSLPLIILFASISVFSFIAAILVCIVPLFYAVRICARYLLLVPCILVANNDSLASARSKSKKIFNSNLFSFLMLSLPLIISSLIATEIVKYFLSSFQGSNIGLLSGLLLAPISTYIYVVLCASIMEFYLSLNPQSTPTDEQHLATT